MAIKFTTTRESAKLNGVKVLVYGKAGSGKTRLCATAPKPIILSAESGLLSLGGFDIPVIEIASLRDLQEAYAFLSTDEKASQFETICLDSVTEIAEIVLNNAKKENKDPRKAYGDLIEKMLDLIKSFRDLKGKNVYFTCKEARVVDASDGTILFVPEMPGSKLGNQIPYYFDEVFNINSGVTKDGESFRFLRTVANFQYEAKDRSGKLDAMEEPNLTNIFAKITGDDNNSQQPKKAASTKGK